MQGASPTLADVHALIAARRLEQAQSLAERLIAERPDDNDVRFILGIIQAERGNFADALPLVRSAVMADDRPPWTRQLALTNLLRDSGDPSGAEGVVRRLLIREPERVQALNALGLALHDQRRFAEAAQALRQAVAIEPRYAAAHLNLALSLEAAGEREQAIAVVEAAQKLDPGNAKYALALATLLEHAQRSAEAKEQYLRSARLDPTNAAEAYRRLGRLLYSQADIFSAIAAYEQAVKLRNDNAEVWNLLGNAYMDIAAISQATRCYAAALSIDPGHADIFDNLLLCHHYDPTFTAEHMFDAHREWAKRFAGGAPMVLARSEPQSIDRVRIGFVSQSFCGGPTGFFLLPLLQNLDRGRFEVFCYSAGVKSDDISAQLRRHADRWHDVSSLDDDALALRIGEDRVDILIDLAGHAPGNRLRAIARKPAPIVATWLDYFDTTGVDAVDYLIADSISTPIDTPQRFTEKVLRIEPSRLCYAPPDYAPLPVPPPLLRNGFVTFGSFNRLAKLAEPVVDLWSRLLLAVPGSRLLLKSAAFNHPTTRAMFSKRFEQRGIESMRLELRGSTPHAQMLAEYADVDVALDPFPYNGGLTTCEALWMGVPVIALLGESMISRQTAALLKSAGLDRWIARTGEEWLTIASDLAGQPTALAESRLSLRSAIAASALVDGYRFARRFEALVDTMVAASVRPRRIG